MAKKTAAETGKPTVEKVVVSAPNFQTLTLTIVGTAPYMQNRFSAKAMQMMADKMAAGSTAGKGKARPPRDFDADLKGAMHISHDGWYGIPAAAFRNACIDACRTVGFKMTHAKMSIFVLHDGSDKVDGTPLVKLVGGEPERTDMPVPNANGNIDIRVRPIWREWGCKIRVRFDADQFTQTDVINLMSRAGVQIGVGEGRHFSKNSNGLGNGTFGVKSAQLTA